MRYAPRALLAGGLGLAASLLVACGGGSGVLASNQAGSLSAQLDQVSSSVASGHCAGANTAASDFSNAVASLGNLNPRLTDNLKQGAVTLSRLAALHCQTQTSSSTTSSSSVTSPSTTTASTSSSTPTSTSTSTSSTPTSSSSATSSTPTNSTSTTPSGGAGIGGGAGNGGGGIGNGNGGGQ